MQIYNEIFILVFLALLGACVGSFCACLMSRYFENKPLFLKRSFCFSCEKNLSFKELVPVFCFIFLRGKCKNCGASFGRFSLIFELLTPLILIFSFLSSQNLLGFLFLSLFLCLLLMLCAMDLRYFAVNEALLWLCFFCGIFYALSLNQDLFYIFDLFLRILAFMGGIFLLQHFVAFFINIKENFKQKNDKNLQNLSSDLSLNQNLKENLEENQKSSQSMGEADILIIGVMAGILSPIYSFLMLFLSSFLALIFVFFKALKYKKFERKIALMPFLSLAFILAFILENIGFGVSL